MAKILCIGAHPDDVELSMAGSIFRMKEVGHEVVLLDITNGEPTPFGSVEIRAKESQRSANFLGVKRYTLDLANRFVEDTIDNRKKIASVFREIKCDYIFTHYEFDSHPDHTAVSKLTEAARFYSKLTKSDIKGEPFYPHRIIYYMPNHIKLNLEPSFCVDISPYMQEKKKILECYESQFLKKGDGIVIQECIDVNHYFGIRIGVEYAEAFYMRETPGIMEIGKLFV